MAPRSKKIRAPSEIFLGTARVESAVRKSVIFVRAAFPSKSVSTFSTRSYFNTVLYPDATKFYFAPQNYF